MSDPVEPWWVAAIGAVIGAVATGIITVHRALTSRVRTQRVKAPDLPVPAPTPTPAGPASEGRWLVGEIIPIVRAHLEQQSAIQQRQLEAITRVEMEARSLREAQERQAGLSRELGGGLATRLEKLSEQYARIEIQLKCLSDDEAPRASRKSSPDETPATRRRGGG